MSLSAKLRRAPLRIVTGAFVLNSGLGKLKADEDTAKALHGMASGTYGFLGKVDPKLFVKSLAVGEMALGGALLAPFVSPVVAGAGLTAFSGSLLNLYWNTDGMHEPNDPRPTMQGLPIAKDVWMAGIGVGLMVDGLLEPAHDKKVEITAARQGKKAGKHSRRDKRKAKKARKQALAAGAGAGVKLGRKASKAAEKAQKQSAKQSTSAAKKTAKRLQGAVEEYGPVVADKLATGAGKARDTAKDYTDQYGPVVAERAKQARDAAKDAYDDYAPVVAERAKQARDAAKDAYDDYAPVVAERAKQASDTVRAAAGDYTDQYGPVVVERAKQARDAAKVAADGARAKVAG